MVPMLPVSVVPRAKMTVIALQPEPLLRSFCVLELSAADARGTMSGTKLMNCIVVEEEDKMLEVLRKRFTDHRTGTYS